MSLQLPWVASGGTPCCCFCCLYPAAGVATYPDNLPDSILAIYAQTPCDCSAGSTTTNTLTKSGTGFSGVNPYSGGSLTISLSGANWSWDEMGYATPCLLQLQDLIFGCAEPCPDGVTWGGGGIYFTDNFPDTLTVNGSDAINRINECTWSGGAWTLQYSSTDYKFRLNGTAKTNPQNTPIGDYGINSVAL